MYRIKTISPRKVQELSLRPCRTYFFLTFTGLVTVHGAFLPGIWGTYLTAQSTRGLLHISSLPVKATSCHGTRIKTSSTFFFRSLAMNDLFMNWECPRATFSSNYTDTRLFDFIFSAPNPFRLGIILHVHPLSAAHPPPQPTQTDCRKTALAPF